MPALPPALPPTLQAAQPELTAVPPEEPPAAGVLSGGAPPRAAGSFHELEHRLEQELAAAREREAALQAALKQRSEAVSELALCPITHEPMIDPVSAADGQTYERSAIEAWLMKGSVPISPLTGEPLKDKTLRPNFLARALARDHSGSSSTQG